VITRRHGEKVNAILAVGPTISTWLLFGLITGIILALIVLISVIFSRDLKRGITTTINENLLEGLGERKVLFLGNLEKELTRRGVIPRKPLDTASDLVYRDFFNEVRIYAVQEGKHLRYGYRSSSTNEAIALGVLLLIPFIIGSVVVFTLSLLRRNSTNRAMFEAGQSAAILTRTADWTPM
jgi:hypothetical protein